MHRIFYHGPDGFLHAHMHIGKVDTFCTEFSRLEHAVTPLSTDNTRKIFDCQAFRFMIFMNKFFIQLNDLVG